MREYIVKILHEVDSEINTFDLYDCDIIGNSLIMINRLEAILKELRVRIVNHSFATKEDEILFFKEQKPEILGRLIFFNKIFQIESKLPNGSDSVVGEYLLGELDSLTYFFDRNLDFYQYYRSRSAAFDGYYFIRGCENIRLNGDSSHLDRDPNFSTGYDYKVAKILANEMLRIYLNKRMQNIGKEKELEETRIRYAKTPIRFTGKKVALIELGYALANSGDINGRRIEIKEMMDFLGSAFNIDLGDYYRTYITIKDRKKDRTIYLSNLIQTLIRKMDEDDAD